MWRTDVEKEKQRQPEAELSACEEPRETPLLARIPIRALTLPEPWERGVGKSRKQPEHEWNDSGHR